MLGQSVKELNETIERLANQERTFIEQAENLTKEDAALYHYYLSCTSNLNQARVILSNMEPGMCSWLKKPDSNQRQPGASRTGNKAGQRVQTAKAQG